jgi:hypothetical protein
MLSYFPFAFSTDFAGTVARIRFSRTVGNDTELRVGSALLNLHCLVADKTAQQINQRASIIVQMKSFSHLRHPCPNKSPTV